MQKLLFLSLLLMTCVVQAQFGPQQIISTQADGTQSVFVADIDGDTYKDVLSANRFGSFISWYKNIDGMGAFGPQITIASLDQPEDIQAADIDGDGDMDVLSVSSPDDLIVRFENLNGQGNFSSQNIISSVADGAKAVITADIDDDDDLDVISASDFSGLAWYENIDGNGNFGSPQVVTTISNTRSVYAADLDNDNDFDLVTNSGGTDTLSWFENLDGQGTFGPEIIITPNTTYPNDVFCIDLDGDEDMDVLTAIPADDKIAWHENLDGMGNFGAEQVISTQADFARAIFAADLDNDLDNDVLSASPNDGKIAWYENTDGQGNFGPQQIITTDTEGTRDVFAADIENDGDIDVFSASQIDDKIAWYENLTFIGLEENELNHVSLSPNPVKDILYINTVLKIKNLKIFDQQGRLLLQNETNTSSIDMSHLPTGLYLVEVITDDGSLVKKVVKE